MISQNNNNLLKLILYDSNYLLPMPVALSEGVINEKERRKQRLIIEGICFRNRIEWDNITF